MTGIEDAIKKVQDKHGEGSIMQAEDEGSQEVEVISTGSLALDKALGIGGLPKGRIVELFGKHGVGKSTSALHVLAEAQKKDDTAVLVDMEHAFDPNYAEEIGVDTDELWISQPDSGEDALDIVETLIKSGSTDVLVIDSVAALVPKAELEGEMGDSHVGLQARLMSQALRKLTGAVPKSNMLLLFVNQIRSQINNSPWGPSTTTTGGRALKFYASVRIQIYFKKKLEKNNQRLGHRIGVNIRKNKLAPPYQKAEFDLIYGKGISKYRELINIGV